MNLKISRKDDFLLKLLESEEELIEREFQLLEQKRRCIEKEINIISKKKVHLNLLHESKKEVQAQMKRVCTKVLKKQSDSPIWAIKLTDVQPLSLTAFVLTHDFTVWKIDFEFIAKGTWKVDRIYSAAHYKGAVKPVTFPIEPSGTHENALKFFLNQDEIDNYILLEPALKKEIIASYDKQRKLKRRAKHNNSFTAYAND